MNMGVGRGVLISIAVGFYIGRMSTPIPNSTPEEPIEIEDSNASADEVRTEQASATPTQGAAVRTENLTESQRDLLEMLGIDVNEVTITPEMITCAEAKVGRERLNEIANGATPSFAEGVSLISCYK